MIDDRDYVEIFDKVLAPRPLTDPECMRCTFIPTVKGDDVTKM